MSNYRYEIDKSNTVRIWLIESELDSPPTFLQPSFPDNTAWTKAQAEEWTTILIASLDDNKSEFIAGNGADDIRVARPVEAEPVIEPVAEEPAPVV